MKKIFFVYGYRLVRCSLGLSGLLVATGCFAQPITQKLQKAFQQFESDSQLKHAMSSLYVIDAKTGEVVFDKNSQVGLAPASTQKIITATTAFELLGKDYRYKTELGYAEEKDNNIRFGTLYIIPHGDPTFGSWRWDGTNENTILAKMIMAIQKTKIKDFSAVLIVGDTLETETIPDGWIWQDIGNYYGAGAEKLNWRENQFELILKSGKNIGDKVEIIGTLPKLYDYDYTSLAISAPKGTGDNAYIYFSLSSNSGFVRGTIPVNENRFIISGALPSASGQFVGTLLDTLDKLGIRNPTFAFRSDNKLLKIKSTDYSIIYSHYSPSLDSIVYWFLKKSINLYGEALIKTFAYEKKGFGSTDSGVAIVKDFWKQKGLDENEINISDGSGLSPQNRVTTHAQVTILKYAKTKDWFPYFYDALPEYNGMKMKSGTIRDVKGFCGYQTSKDGKEYIFSFLVNNYYGRTSEVVNKMYKVLDELK